MAKKRGNIKKGKKSKKNKKGKKGKKQLSSKGKPSPKPPIIQPVICQTNTYPGILQKPQEFVAISIQCGIYQEICQCLANVFPSCNRVLLMTPWGNYAIYQEFNGHENVFYLFSGCSCTTNILRYLDLHKGTAGFLYFQTMHELIEFILNDRFKREKYKILPKTQDIDRICYNFCTQGGTNLYKVCNKRGEISDVGDFMIQQCMFPRCKKPCKI